jgi:hypothetical protein
MKTVLNLIMIFVLVCNVNSQTKEDTTAIIGTALDYFEGWYTADTIRMDRALHADLIKRRVIVDDSGRYTINQLTKPIMMEKTRTHKIVPLNEQDIKVAVLDIYKNAASVRAESNGFVDYIHMSRINGRWVIMNVLWEKKPKIK